MWTRLNLALPATGSAQHDHNQTLPILPPQEARLALRRSPNPARWPVGMVQAVYVTQHKALPRQTDGIQIMNNTDGNLAALAVYLDEQDELDRHNGIDGDPERWMDVALSCFDYDAEGCIELMDDDTSEPWFRLKLPNCHVMESDGVDDAEVLRLALIYDNYLNAINDTRDIDVDATRRLRAFYVAGGVARAVMFAIEAEQDIDRTSAIY